MSDVASAGSLAAVIIVAYAIGTFPTAVLVGRRLGFDPTRTGSGNPGASNAARVGGFRAGALVLAGDAGKGAVSAGLGYAVDGRTVAWLAGTAAVAGHMWPVTRRFRGGKGVATVAGVGVICAPVAAVCLALVFAVTVKVSRRAAMGSLVVAFVLPATLAVLGREIFEVLIGVALGVAIVVRHRSNIRQMLGRDTDIRD